MLSKAIDGKPEPNGEWKRVAAEKRGRKRLGWGRCGSVSDAREDRGLDFVFLCSWVLNAERFSLLFSKLPSPS
jgi:hypothetical protein